MSLSSSKSVVVEVVTDGQKLRKILSIGRKGAAKQEQVFKRTVLNDREQLLVKSCREAKEAATQFSDDVKAVAEQCGLNAATVRRYIIAKAGEHYDEAKGKVAQLSLIFDV